MPLTKQSSLILKAIVLISALQFISCSQTDSLPKKEIPVLDVNSAGKQDTVPKRGRPMNFYYTVSQHYPNCWMGATVGEIVHINKKLKYGRELIPHDLFEWRGTSCDREHEGITILDSLASQNRTEYRIMHNGDVVGLLFGTFIATHSDTCEWYNVTDTIAVYIVAMDSTTGKAIQTRDSCIFLPFNHTSDIDPSSFHKSMDVAIANPKKFPLFETYILHLPVDSIKACLQIRISFGATDPIHSPNVTNEVDCHPYRISDNMIRFNAQSKDELSEVQERISTLCNKLSDDVDASLAKVLKIHEYKQFVDEEFQFGFTSSQGREYSLRAVNEQGETVHDFGKSYAFPGMEQTFKWATANQPRGVYAVTISCGGKLCYLVPFIVRHNGEKLVPRVPASVK